MASQPPAGLVERPEDLFRRSKREAAFYLSFIGRQYLPQFFVCILIVFIHLFILTTPIFERFEYIFLDYFFRQRPAQLVHPDIAYIEIAEDSIQGIGRWPWPRQYHAVMTHILTEWKAKAIVFDMLFSESSTELDDGALKEALEKSDQTYLSVVLEQQGDQKIWIHSLPEFEQSAKGVGHINVQPDKDGTLRRVKPYVEYGGQSYPHLALRVAYDFLEKPEKISDWKKTNELLINWAGKWDKTFKHYSYVDLIKSFEAVQNGQPPIIPPSEIEGKICLIGLTAFGHSDIKASPMEPAYPGVGVHANIINSVLTNRLIRSASFKVNALCLVLVGLLTSAFFVIFRSVRGLIGGLLIGFIWTFISYVSFARYGLWLYTVQPLSVIILLYVFSTVYVLILKNRERLRLFRLATRDGLTGLYVIRHFRFLLNQAVQESHKRKKSLSVILGDIDYFKKVNDTYGHACGDMVLKEVASVVQASIDNTEKSEKENHIAARYGGEEFIVLLRNFNLSDAAFKYAETLRKAIESRELIWEGKPIHVTISLGVAVLHPKEAVPDIMVHRADSALYRAKAEGRNRVCIEDAQKKSV